MEFKEKITVEEVMASDVVNIKVFSHSNCIAI